MEREKATLPALVVDLDSQRVQRDRYRKGFVPIVASCRVRFRVLETYNDAL